MKTYKFPECRFFSFHCNLKNDKLICSYEGCQNCCYECKNEQCASHHTKGLLDPFFIIVWKIKLKKLLNEDKKAQKSIS